MWRPGSLLSITVGALGHVTGKRKPQSKQPGERPRLTLVRPDTALPAPLNGDWISFRIRWGAILIGLLGLGLLGGLIYWEAQTSGIEAFIATKLGKQLTYRVEPGSNQEMVFPQDAPYDTTLGYSLIPSFTRRLGLFGFEITEQARLSPAHRAFTSTGLSPIYQEKSVTGLKIKGQNGDVVASSQYPTLRYETLASVPNLVTLSLLFIEDRHLLERQDVASINPAVSWERLSKATLDLILDRIFGDRNVPGGSTLATQIEKFRHSPEGRTKTPVDKLKQMTSATARAYLLGGDTRAAREQIILDYINEVPLGAVPGMGEVKGLGEALRAWYGVEFSAINAALEAKTPTSIQGMSVDAARQEVLKSKASAFKKVLALFLSQRRPAFYLQKDQRELARLANSYIRVMQKSGMIDADLAQAALAAPLNILPPLVRRDGLSRQSFVDRKAINAVRVDLMKLLGVRTMYELDRLDIEVSSTFNAELQRNISAFLSSIKNRDQAMKAGVFGENMLRQGQESLVDYSFTLMERKDDFNAVRVQTDTVDSPLDLNRGGKLELGSTAKLRTLLTYLEMIADTHEKVAVLKHQSLDGVDVLGEALVKTPESDTMTRWVMDWMRNPHNADDSLPALLSASLNRTFSASPYQAFRTGGGVLTFGNFNADENGLHLSVLEAFQRSNNLVFVRVMQEIVSHVIMSRIPDGAAILAEVEHPKRKMYLDQFVELEGSAFVRRFFRDLKGKTTDERLAQLAAQRSLTSSRWGALLLSLRPDLDYLGFRVALLEKFSSLEDKVVERYWATMRPGVMSLSDRAFVARVHPIALWMVRYLDQNPKASIADLMFDSLSIRKMSYAWLTEKAGPRRQERDIRTMLEREAFQKHILRYWQRQGFPFAQMVPSLASALGSSGDRPSSLADLMGSIHNHGVLLPTRRIEELRLGADTPYETALGYSFSGARRAIRPEVAEVARLAVRAVVDGGTARRLKGSLRRTDGLELSIAGKTGTGDNRLETYGPGGRLVRSDGKSRTATLVFALGDRFYGAMTAYVKAEKADVDDFAFTSSLVVQVVRSMMPIIAPHVLKVEDPWSLAFE